MPKFLWWPHSRNKFSNFCARRPFATSIQIFGRFAKRSFDMAQTHNEAKPALQNNTNFLLTNVSSRSRLKFFPRVIPNMYLFSRITSLKSINWFFDQSFFVLEVDIHHIDRLLNKTLGLKRVLSSKRQGHSRPTKVRLHSRSINCTLGEEDL